LGAALRLRSAAGVLVCVASLTRAGRSRCCRSSSLASRSSSSIAPTAAPEDARGCEYRPHGAEKQEKRRGERGGRVLTWRHPRSPLLALLAPVVRVRDACAAARWRPERRCGAC
jgi:hypothetical protein